MGKRKPDHARGAGELASLAAERSNHVLAVTTPIYRPLGEDDAELIGSGVLLRLGAGSFLLTASHVLKCRGDRGLLAGVSTGLQPIVGEPTYLFASGSKEP